MTTALIGPLRVTPRGELASAAGIDLWRHHIRAALLTRARWNDDDAPESGERWMREDFGCRIHRLLHEPLSDETAALAEALLVEDLKQSLPHLPLTHIETTIDDANAALAIKLVFETPAGQALHTTVRIEDGRVVAREEENPCPD